MKKVLIDPGHSVDCPNSGIHGYKEFSGMWKLSNFLKEILTASGGIDANRKRGPFP
jgi:N-acetylmuramoyl-L-alanine amidase